MKLSINDPNRAKERQAVEPLTLHQLTESIGIINYMIERLSTLSNTEINDIQSLLDGYQNYRYFFEFVGGWEGYERLLLGLPDVKNKVSDYNESHLLDSNITTTSDIKVEYELVKPHSKPKKTFKEKMYAKMKKAQEEYEQRKNQCNG